MRPDRALWVALGVLLVTFAAWQLQQRGPGGVSWMPQCVFHQVTGLHCPGCGMTRATYATFHGRFGDAFRLNPVGMVLFPLALLGISFELVGWVRGKPLPFRLHLGRWGSTAIAAVVIAFWILRNIPAWPFNLLAPH